MITIHLLAAHSPHHAQALALRQRLLRTPLGLTFTAADHAQDSLHLHFAALDGCLLVGTALLVPPTADQTAKIRQVAVDPSRAREGIGTRLIHEAEAQAARLGARTVTLNARLPSVPFYERLAYRQEGEVFTEVTIPHIRMVKTLDAPCPPFSPSSSLPP